MNFQFLRKNEQFVANFFLFVLEIRNSDSAEQLDTAQVIWPVNSKIKLIFEK